MNTHQGSCHCGAISFTYDGQIDGVVSCNCSHCRRKGFLLAFGPVDAMKVDAAEGALTQYNFHKNVIDYFFCTICGTGTHAFGEVKGNKMVAVNVRCIPALDLDALPVTKVDGASF